MNETHALMAIMSELESPLLSIEPMLSMVLQIQSVKYKCKKTTLQYPIYANYPTVLYLLRNPHVCKLITHVARTMATASFNMLSPKTSMYSNGSTANAWKIAKVATGSTAEIRAPNANASMARSSKTRPAWPGRFEVEV